MTAQELQKHYQTLRSQALFTEWHFTMEKSRMRHNLQLAGYLQLRTRLICNNEFEAADLLNEIICDVRIEG